MTAEMNVPNAGNALCANVNSSVDRMSGMLAVERIIKDMSSEDSQRGSTLSEYVAMYMAIQNLKWWYDHF